MSDKKFRSHSCGALFTCRKVFTDSDKEELVSLENKKSDSSVKWLAKDDSKLLSLLNIRDSYKTLPSGAITYVHELVNKEVYGYSDRVYTKPMQKGDAVENDIIEIHNQVFFTNYRKSDICLENDLFIGHPDVVDECNFFILDAKASWNKKTHPKKTSEAFDSNYEWQVKSYLYGKRFDAGIIDTSCLIDPIWTNGRVFFGLTDTPSELLDVLYEDMSLHEGINSLPLSLRATWFDVTLTDDDIHFMKSRVKAAQSEYDRYKKELLSKI